MKNLQLLNLVLFSLIAVKAQSQWVQTSGQPGIPEGFGWTGAYIKSIAAVGTNIFAGTERGVYVSEDGGQTWVHRSPGGEMMVAWYVGEFATNGSEIYAGLTPPSLISGVFKSSDLGITWTSVNSRFESCTEPIHLAIAQNDIFEASGQGFASGINKSSLAGINTNSWFSFSNGLYDSTAFYHEKPGVSALTISGSFLLAGIKHAWGTDIIDGVYISPVDTANWVITSGISPSNIITSFCENRGVIIAGNKQGTPVLYRSTDGGFHWEAASTAAFLDKPVLSLFHNNDTIYAGTSGNGALISKDNGITWTEFNDGFKDGNGNLVSGDINSFVIIGNTIYAATHNGVWKRSLFSVVPVNLLSFAAINKSNHSYLTWQTTSEINTKNFVLERSKNATDFETVVTLPAAGYSYTIKKYAYTDITPYDGVNYYRLKQVDDDGGYGYSKTVLLNFPKKTNSTVYPNPATSFISIMARDKLKAIEIINVAGKTVQRMQPAVTNQYNINSLPNGVYSLKLLYENKFEIVQLIKQ